MDVPCVMAAVYVAWLVFVLYQLLNILNLTPEHSPMFKGSKEAAYKTLKLVEIHCGVCDDQHPGNFPGLAVRRYPGLCWWVYWQAWSWRKKQTTNNSN